MEKHACVIWDLPFCQDYVIYGTPNQGAWGSWLPFIHLPKQQVEKQILLTANTHHSTLCRISDSEAFL